MIFAEILSVYIDYCRTRTEHFSVRVHNSLTIGVHYVLCPLKDFFSKCDQSGIHKTYPHIICIRN